MRRFLLSFRSLSNFRLQRELGRRLLGLGHHVAFIYEGGEDDFCQLVRAEANTLPSDVLAFDVFLSPDRISPPLRRRSPRRLRSRAVKLALRRISSAKPFEQIHGQALAAANEVLNRTRPDALIVNEDGISGHLALITAARHRDIKILDVPFGFFVRSEFDADLARKSALGELHRPDPKRESLMRWLAPQWLKRGEFAGAIMHPDLYILAAEAMGITLEDAWTVHGGVADVLCAESEATARSYRKEGISSGKIVITGSPYTDVMFDALAADAAAKHAFGHAVPIEPDRMRILVSWPPSYHDTRPGTNEFPTYEAMTRTVLGALGKIGGAHITVSLHPACGPVARQAALDAGLTPSDEYVVELIPKHDIYVASFSSTIRWATAAGKPVVNYDAYGWNLQQFNSGGFFNETRFETLMSRLTELVGSRQAYRGAAEAQVESAAQWGIVDGLSTRRIADTLDRLMR